MSDNFPDVLRTHAESMNSEGWYTVANALVRAAAEIEDLRLWKTKESETQEALQTLGEEFGVHGGEPRVSGIRRVLTELRSSTAIVDGPKIWCLPTVEKTLNEMLAVATNQDDEDDEQWPVDFRAAVDLWQASIRDNLVEPSARFNAPDIEE